MKAFLQNLKGDKVVWGIVILMSVASMVVVYSAISNLAWRSPDDGKVLLMTLKHSLHLGIGLVILYLVHKIPYKYFSYAALALPFVIGLLIFTLLQGNQIQGANAARWIQIPFMGIGIQTSTIASVVLYVYVAKYLSRNQDKKIVFKEALIKVWLPVILVAGSILPANFSTAAMIVLNVGIIMLIGRYPVKHLFGMSVFGIALLSIFVITAINFPDMFNNRVNTWMSRIEKFGSEQTEEQYQVKAAKAAIAIGGVLGKGPGKSVQKNHLPQSSSDFIFAIVIEEFGFVGALGLIALYLIFLIRVTIIAGKAPTLFGTLLVLSLGLPIVVQALINMSVAVGLMPVTGQPLPLISSGGTSIWMVGLAIGIILSVSREAQAVKAAGQEEEIDVDNKILEEVETVA